MHGESSNNLTVTNHTKVDMEPQSPVAPPQVLPSSSSSLSGSLPQVLKGMDICGLYPVTTLSDQQIEPLDPHGFQKNFDQTSEEVRKARYAKLALDDFEAYEEQLAWDKYEAHEAEVKAYYAQLALDYYNDNNKDSKYELIVSFGYNTLLMSGIWVHVCFLAKPICSSGDAYADRPRYFFAEIANPVGRSGYILCRIVDPNSSETMEGCRQCPHDSYMYHPTDGFEAGNYHNPYSWECETIPGGCPLP